MNVVSRAPLVPSGSLSTCTRMSAPSPHELADAVGARLRRSAPSGVRRLHDVGDVQERGALEADVDEGGLHAGQHARHAALVQVAGEAAPAGALDEQLLQHAVLEQRRARFARADVDDHLGGHAADPSGKQPRDAAQQFPGLEQRQAHDAGVAAGNVADEDRRAALHRVAAGLVGRLAGAPVPVHLGRVSSRIVTLAAADARCGAARVQHRDRRVDLVRAAREPLRAWRRLRRVGRLAEDLAFERHGRVGRQHRQAPVRRQAAPRAREPWPRPAAARRPRAPRPAARTRRAPRAGPRGQCRSAAAARCDAARRRRAGSSGGIMQAFSRRRPWPRGCAPPTSELLIRQTCSARCIG